MSNFQGEYENSIDAKGRIAVPSKLRSFFPKEAPNAVVVTRDFEPCLQIQTAPYWAGVLAQVAALNPYLQSTRDFRRRFISPASEQEMDKQGRVNLPDLLCREVGIEPGTSVLILGVGPYLEVWDPKTYRDYMGRRSPQEYAHLAETVMGPPPVPAIPPGLLG